MSENGLEHLELLKRLTGAPEAYLVTRYLVCSGKKRIHVEVHDGGPTMGMARYSAKATQENGLTVIGNPDKTAEYALQNVHWSERD